MRTLFAALVLSSLVISCGPTPGTEKVTMKPVESDHSQAFNAAVMDIFTKYDSLTEAFVNWDSTAVNKLEPELETSLQAWKLDELKNDSANYTSAVSLYNTINLQMEHMKQAGGLEQKRRELDTLSRKLYELLDVVSYDQTKIYLQKCPMAFNDTETAMWLTRKGKDEIRNPYLGTKHPVYGDGMLECGDNEKILDKLK